jgi:hypothetical protein
MSRRRFALWIGLCALLFLGLIALWTHSHTTRPVAVEEPLNSRNAGEFVAADLQGHELFNVFSSPGNPGPISINLPFLNEFAGPNRQLLLRHLATSAKWFVGREHGKIFAYRRYVLDGRWQNTLHGYLSSSDLDDSGEESSFQFRILLGINGPVMAKPWQKKATFVRADAAYVQLKVQEDLQEHQGYESYLVVESKGAALEIFEQLPSMNRPFTPLALTQIRNEFQRVLASNPAKQNGFDPSLMPAQSIKRGQPEMTLVNGMQPGIYQVYAYLNPGESGYVYLKVFKATGTDVISDSLLKDDSSEYVGWSSDPGEQFFYNTGILIGVDSWSDSFPARLEMWFVPDSGAPERKILQRVFHIEQWKR